MVLRVDNKRRMLIPQPQYLFVRRKFIAGLTRRIVKTLLVRATQMSHSNELMLYKVLLHTPNYILVNLYSENLFSIPISQVGDKISKYMLIAEV